MISINSTMLNSSKNDASLISFICSLFQPHVIKLCGLVTIAFIYALDMTVRPYMVKLIIDRVVDNPEHQNIARLLFLPVLCYIGMLILLNFSFRFWDYIWLKVFPLIKADIAEKALHYLGFHSHEYFQTHFSGTIVNKITILDHEIEQIVKIIINGFLPHILALVIGGIAITSVSPLFSSVIFIWSIIFFIISIKVSSRAKNLSKIFSEAKSQCMGKIGDFIINISNVRLFARNEHELYVIKEKFKDVISKDQEAQKCRLFIQIFQGISVIILILSLLLLLIHLKQLNIITVGDFALIITLSFSLSDTVKTLSSDYINFSTYLGNCSQALITINQPHDIRDKPETYPLIVTEGKIELKNISFGYKDCNLLFSNQSISILGKEKVGIVGFSGSGKSTLVNLIIRLFDVNSGKILIDNQNITEVTQTSLRKNIAFIPQDSALFHRTLMENIRYGNLEATYDEVIDAARKARIHEFIITLPDGYNSIVGERGIKLSGGQRQRIAIARALLKNAPILILDEATGSLDSITEQLIQEGLKELMKNKTTLIVAHRLSTLLTMDRIIVLNNGKIIGDGPHKNLLKTNSLYKELWVRQMGG